MSTAGGTRNLNRQLRQPKNIRIRSSMAVCFGERGGMGPLSRSPRVYKKPCCMPAGHADVGCEKHDNGQGPCGGSGGGDTRWMTYAGWMHPIDPALSTVAGNCVTA